MLTSHALSPDDFGKSIAGGAKAYIPKEKMADITTFLSDILEAKTKLCLISSEFTANSGFAFRFFGYLFFAVSCYLPLI